MSWRDHLTATEATALHAHELAAATAEFVAADAYAAVRKIRNACVQRQRRSRNKP